KLKTEFRALVEACLAPFPATARLVVILDDLDRCLPDTVVSLIEAVKLFLCGAADCRAVFVFAMDRSIVGEAIRNRYPGATSYTGDHYLEKIFTASFEVPRLGGTELGELIKSLQSQRPPLQMPFDASTLQHVLAQPVFANARTVRRTLNKVLLLAQTNCASRVPQAEHPQFIAFLAGAERFRDFREFLRSASQEEFAKAVGALPSHAIELSKIASRLTQTPGFAVYMSLLGVAGYEAVPKLLGYDDILRSVAL
ncbi:MAG: P-loop NTPase fold protein, partial [Haliangium ochraceum]